MTDIKDLIAETNALTPSTLEGVGLPSIAFRSNADEEEYKSLDETDPQLCEDLKDHEYAIGYVEGLLEMMGDFVTLSKQHKALVQQLEKAETVIQHYAESTHPFEGNDFGASARAYLSEGEKK